MEDDVEIDVIYHGTTRGAADAIVAAKRFSEHETFFASDAPLAWYFARRTCAKAGGGTPAVVRVPLYRSDLAAWRLGRLLVRKGFDDGDAPELRGRIQLLLSSGAMKHLNRLSFSDEWTVLAAP